MGVGGKKGTPVRFEPMKRTATVEKVAINGVMARHLYEAGFKSKDEVYQWLYDSSFKPLKEYHSPQWRAGRYHPVEKLSGKSWDELPDDYMIPAVGDPYENCIIVAGGGEETSHWVNGRTANADPAYGIDIWC
jgi:hypothetical protein